MTDEKPTKEFYGVSPLQACVADMRRVTQFAHDYPDEYMRLVAEMYEERLEEQE